MNQYISGFACLLTAVVATTPMALSAEPYADRISLSPMLGLQSFDNDYRIGDLRMGDLPYFGSIGVGYTLSENGEIELTYLVGKGENDIGLERHFDQFRIDYLRHFKQYGKVTPYAVGGVGHQRLEWWNSDLETENSLVNLGGGLNIGIGQSFSLRGDARVLHDLDYGYTNFALAVGLHFTFGERAGLRKSSTAPPSRPIEPIVVLPADSDGDGVNDSLDRCSDSPQDTEVGADGCEIAPSDGDGDGVLDSADKCPDTETGALIDEAGCYRMLSETREVNINVVFANNSAEIDPVSYEEINRVAEFMTQYPQTEAVIEGHSDDRGAADYNQQLSQRRAESVVQTLVKRFGVNPDRLSAVGYGEERPLVPNDSAENRAKNRRVTAQVSTQVKVRQQRDAETQASEL